MLEAHHKHVPWLPWPRRALLVCVTLCWHCWCSSRSTRMSSLLQVQCATSFCVVNLQPSEAKVEAMLDSYVSLFEDEQHAQGMENKDIFMYDDDEADAYQVLLSSNSAWISAQHGIHAPPDTVVSRQWIINWGECKLDLHKVWYCFSTRSCFLTHATLFW